MSDDTVNRRKEGRVTFRIPAILIWLDEGGEEIKENAFTLSISKSGAGFETLRLPPVGGRIQVILNTQSLCGSSSATVRWAMKRAHGFEIGVSFDD